MGTKQNITQERLKELLIYDENTGLLLNRIDRCGMKQGSEVGSFIKRTKYREVTLDGKAYLVHRLIWFYVHGYFPEHNIDHINRIRDDNRLCNLREATQACNVRNSGMCINNTSGVTGVSLQKVVNHWVAQISVNYNNKYLGIYKNFEDAVLSRWQAEVKYDFPNCNSTSSAYQYLKDHNLLPKE